jgi:hypothetical protein
MVNKHLNRYCRLTFRYILTIGYFTLNSVLLIRIRRIHMFLGLTILIHYSSSSKNSKKNIDSYCFLTFYDFLTLKNVNVPSKSYKQKKNFC